MTEPHRPRLRAHARLEGTRVLDGLLERGYDLGPLGAALVARLDGERSVDELATAEDQRHVLRRLYLLNLVEGAGDGVVARLEAALAGRAPFEIRAVEGTRFQCQGTGECCQNYVFGPLDDEDIARLAALPLAEAFPHTAGGYVEETEERGMRFRFLKSVKGDRCTFLEGDGRCGIHRRFGADAKPRFCRLFPYEFIATYDGMRVFDKGSCAAFGVSSQQGPKLIDDLARLRPLLPRERAGLYHPVVHVDEFPCDFGHFERLTATAIGLTQKGIGDAAETLRAVARGVRGFAHVLRSFPLEAGEPDASISGLLATAGPLWYQGEPPTPELHTGAMHLGHIFAALLVSSTGVIQDDQDRPGYFALKLVRQSAELFHLASAAAMRVVDPATQFDAETEAVLAVRVGGPEIDAVLRQSLCQQLFGSGSLVEGHSLAALVRLSLIQLVCVHGARIRARADGRDVAEARDLSWGHMLATRVLARADAAPIMLAAENEFAAMLEAVPAVAGLGQRLPMP